MTPEGALDISVVIPTYNRAAQLRPVLESLLSQDAGDVRYEVIVVDNNSTDDTRGVVTDMIGQAMPGLLRYVFEPRRGVSYARNTGVEQAHPLSPIIAFLDDDGVPVQDWVRGMKRAFDEHPDVDCIGGRIRPLWTTPPPRWMSPAHAGPLALQDRPKPARLDSANASSCLLSANLACRRSVFSEVGGFSPRYPRNQDREFEMRLWRAGKRGLYLPDMDVVVEVPADRLTKAYHRRWQATTGSYHALMRFRDTVDSSGRMVAETTVRRRWLGAPLFLYRECFQHAAGWCTATLRRDAPQRFFHESRLWYYKGFFATRLKTDVATRFRIPGRRAAARRLPRVSV
jgi:glucosyl-dolichyl phosphate glucuronosyltransferase